MRTEKIQKKPPAEARILCVLYTFVKSRRSVDLCRIEIQVYGCQYHSIRNVYCTVRAFQNTYENLSGWMTRQEETKEK
jgi:hypothetical protein